jgi:hypothetical protein
VDLQEFKLVIGQLLATFTQAVEDEKTRADSQAAGLGEILAGMRAALAPVDTAPCCSGSCI